MCEDEIVDRDSLCGEVESLAEGGVHGVVFGMVSEMLPLSVPVAQQPSLDSLVVVEKYLLHKQGVVACATCRGPLSFHLGPETRAEVDRLFGQFGRVSGLADALAKGEGPCDASGDTGRG
jgi:dihydrodipicolinate synthase/N-acetylneuraminate lyase